MRLPPIDDPTHVALRVVAPRLTPRFRGQVARFDGTIAPTSMPGVHEGTLCGFALRVVETAVAYPGEHEHLLPTLGAH